MNIPITAGEASIAVLALIILREVLSTLLSGRSSKENGTNHTKPPCMTIEQHDRECRLKLKPIMDGIEDLKGRTIENKQAIEANRDMVMKELKDLPMKINGGSSRK